MLLIICRSGACGLPGERHGFPSSLWYVTSREPTYVAVLVYVHWPLIISGIPQSIQLSLLLYQTIFYGEIAFPLCMSGVITVSITGRIALVRGKHIKLMGLYMAHPLTETILPLRSNQHRQFLHFEHLMLIESFALKSAWLFDQLIVNLTARNAVTLAVNMIFHNTQPFVQVSKISLSCLPTKVLIITVTCLPSCRTQSYHEEGMEGGYRRKAHYFTVESE